MMESILELCMHLNAVDKINYLHHSANGGIVFTLATDPREHYLILDQFLKDELSGRLHVSATFQTTSEAWEILQQAKDLQHYCAVYKKDIGGIPLTTVAYSRVPSYAYLTYYDPSTTAQERDLISEVCDAHENDRELFREHLNQYCLIADGTLQPQMFPSLYEIFKEFPDKKGSKLVFFQFHASSIPRSSMDGSHVKVSL